MIAFLLLLLAVEIEPEGARCVARYERPAYSKPASYGDIHWDHVVALKEAWESGACTWPLDRWEEFASDRENLIPATPGLNVSKGARDPAEWKGLGARIPSRAGRCVLLETHVHVKRKWGLSMDALERDVVDHMIETNRCRR